MNDSALAAGAETNEPTKVSSGVSGKTWAAVLLAVAGVGFLELPGAMEGGGIGVGDVVALGQPLGFGVSYVILERAMRRFPDDSLALSALQCLVVGLSALAAATLSSASPGTFDHVSMASLGNTLQSLPKPWDLAWDHLMPSLDPSTPSSVSWAVPAAIGYTGLVSTALTIWFCAVCFKYLPSLP